MNNDTNPVPVEISALAGTINSERAKVCDAIAASLEHARRVDGRT